MWIGGCCLRCLYSPVGNVADCVLLFCWLRCLSVDDLDFPPVEDTGLVDGLVIVGHLLFPDLNGDGSLKSTSTHNYINSYILTIQSNLYIKATLGNLKMWPL